MLDTTSPLTDDLRVAMRDALDEAMSGDDAIARRGAHLYLRDLDRAKLGDPLGSLIDVLEYFGMLDEEGNLDQNLYN